jgi:hypothetical protein
MHRLRQTSPETLPTAQTLLLKADPQSLCLLPLLAYQLARHRARATPTLPTFTLAHFDLPRGRQIHRATPWHRLLASQPHLQQLLGQGVRLVRYLLDLCRRLGFNPPLGSGAVEDGEGRGKPKKNRQTLVSSYYLLY